MILAELIASETGVALENVMLLRHSNQIIEALLRRGSSIEEYTRLQPVGSKYDYTDSSKPLIKAVVVIVHDSVWGVYRVLGVEREGTTYDLSSEAHRSFDIERGAYERPAKLFRMELISSSSLGHVVIGWEGKSRTPVQRYDGGFFRSITVNLPLNPIAEHTLREAQDEAVDKSIKGDSDDRKKRLAIAPRLPARREVISTIFLRSPDVIAEVLLRAAGTCELCKSPAPFVRQSDGTPYLEVHHRQRLADGGEDTVDNAIAICPNCHRREHYG